jgi:hypothetical protein
MVNAPDGGEPVFSATFTAEKARSNVDVKVGSNTPNFTLAGDKSTHQESY